MLVWNIMHIMCVHTIMTYLECIRGDYVEPLLKVQVSYERKQVLFSPTSEVGQAISMQALVGKLQLS